jgi:glycosyltransferase involved in cell wall biosynthesis
MSITGIEAMMPSRPLRIVQFATGFPSWGGTELHLLNLSEQLQLRGHDVTVACRPGKWVESRAKELGLATVGFNVMRQFDLQDFPQIRRFLRSKHVDVVHAHWSTDIVAAGLGGLLEHVPVRVLSRHMPYPFKNRVGATVYTQLFFTNTVTVSDSVRKVLLRSGVPDRRVEVIHHGTDVENFQHITQARDKIRDELAIEPDQVAVGIIGRIAQEKGHRYLVEAIHTLASDRSLKLVVVGNGPDEDRIKEQVAALGMIDRVSFLGFRDDINNVINALDIVTVPSTWNEPCSAVIQQAMALRKPVVGTTTGGSPEMVISGKTGILVPPSNSGALANAIAELAINRELRQSMGAAGATRVETLFSLRVMVDKIEALYNRELQRSSGSSAMKNTLASSYSKG